MTIALVPRKSLPSARCCYSCMYMLPSSTANMDWPAGVHEGHGILASGEAVSSPGSYGNSPWQAGRAAGMVLSTLYLAMEWILQAHPANRSAITTTALPLCILLCCLMTTHQRMRQFLNRVMERSNSTVVFISLLIQAHQLSIASLLLYLQHCHIQLNMSCLGRILLLLAVYSERLL